MKQRNFWPLGIFLITIVVVGMIIWTIVIALRNPVELDNSYMSHYQYVDSNINEIQKAQKHFWSLYALAPFPNFLPMQLDDGIQFKIMGRENSRGISGAKVSLRLTRPHTAREDIELGEAIEYEAGIYATKALHFPKQGRWILQMTIRIQDAHGYFEKEFIAKQ